MDDAVGAAVGDHRQFGRFEVFDDQRELFGDGGASVLIAADGMSVNRQRPEFIDDGAEAGMHHASAMSGVS